MLNETSRPNLSGSQFNQGVQFQIARPMQQVPYGRNSDLPYDGNACVPKQETKSFEDDELCLFEM